MSTYIEKAKQILEKANAEFIELCRTVSIG